MFLYFAIFAMLLLAIFGALTFGNTFRIWLMTLILLFAVIVA